MADLSRRQFVQGLAAALAIAATPTVLSETLPALLPSDIEYRVERDPTRRVWDVVGTQHRGPGRKVGCRVPVPDGACANLGHDYCIEQAKVLIAQRIGEFRG